MPDMDDAEKAYQEALTYLNQFINYERKMTDIYAPEKMDPGRPARLLALLGNPHQAYPAVHIAGTKGKGSVAALCASTLRAAGLKVGLFTSPHLQEFRERIRVLTPADADGRITPGDFAALVERLRQAIPQVPGITWFELVAALGFMHFAAEKVDVAVVEVGLGGRLDATNVLLPLVSVITSLSLDHTGLLGDTLAAIAGEKGGIIKPGVPVVSAPQAPEAMAVLEALAFEHQAPLIVAGREWRYEGTASADGRQQWITIEAAPLPGCVPPQTRFAVPLAGRFQQENAVVALAALCLLRPHFPMLTLPVLEEGLRSVHWPGRVQVLHQRPGDPTLLVDSAHNPDSARRLAQTLTDFHHRRLWLVLGMTADKDVRGILAALLPGAAGVFVTMSEHPRAARPEQLADYAAELGHSVQVVPGVADAVRAAWAAAGPEDLVCVTGSIFVVGDLLNCWDNLQSALVVNS